MEGTKRQVYQTRRGREKKSQHESLKESKYFRQIKSQALTRDDSEGSSIGTVPSSSGPASFSSLEAAKEITELPSYILAISIHAPFVSLPQVFEERCPTCVAQDGRKPSRCSAELTRTPASLRHKAAEVQRLRSPSL